MEDILEDSFRDLEPKVSIEQTLKILYTSLRSSTHLRCWDYFQAHKDNLKLGLDSTSWVKQKVYPSLWDKPSLSIFSRSHGYRVHLATTCSEKPYSQPTASVGAEPRGRNWEAVSSPPGQRRKQWLNPALHPEQRGPSACTATRCTPHVITPGRM